MPNHVTNIIEITGNPARIKSLFETVKNDEYGLGSMCGEYRPAQQEAINFANSLWGFDGMEEDEDMDDGESMEGMKL